MSSPFEKISLPARTPKERPEAEDERLRFSNGEPVRTEYANLGEVVQDMIKVQNDEDAFTVLKSLVVCTTRQKRSGTLIGKMKSAVSHVWGDAATTTRKDMAAMLEMQILDNLPFVLEYEYLNAHPHQKQIWENLLAKTREGQFPLVLSTTKKSLTDS